MTFQAQDHVSHKTTGQKMVVRGIDDFDGRELVWCEWSDANGDLRATTFPADELQGDAAASTR